MQRESLASQRSEYSPTFRSRGGTGGGMVDDKHSASLIVQNPERGTPTNIVRWERHYHYVDPDEQRQTVCGMNIPPGSITRGSDFARAIGQTDAICSECRGIRCSN